MIGYRLSARMRAVLVAGVMSAVGLSFIPASAVQVPPPVVQNTSLSAGGTWSKINNAISVDYNRAIDVSQSSVTVTDGAGQPVLGTVDTPHVFDGQGNRLEVDRSILYILPFVALSEENGPYTASFSARAFNQITGTLNTDSTYTFRLDLKKPTAPSLSNSGTPVPRNSVPNTGLPNPLPTMVMSLAPGDSALLSGLARDTLDSQGNEDHASGISKVTLHFFAAHSVYVDPGAPSPEDPPTFGAIETRRVTLVNSCQSNLCPTSFSYQHSETLTAGYWTVRVSTEDLAGNISGQSDPVAFIALG